MVSPPKISPALPTPIHNHQDLKEETVIKPSPTPDQIRQAPELRELNEIHVVDERDDLLKIARQYEVGVQQILTVNGRDYSDPLTIGQVLIIPPPVPESPAPYFKIIPDSELVYGPSTVSLATIETIFPEESPLVNYVEEIDGTILHGPAILQRAAIKYSINPRILFSVVHYLCNWSEDSEGCFTANHFSLGWEYEPEMEGFYKQLSWLADQLNFGFYRWWSGWNGPFIFPDGSVVIPAPGINAGTAALQHLFSRLYLVEDWREVVGKEGFYKAYYSLYGDPFELAIEPILPPDLTQPVLNLPFESGVPWSFTGGPHSAIGNWAAWGALDFAPSMSAPGCEPSEDWVVAIADGKITRSYWGQVVLDLDGDGFEQTGWAVLYLHVATKDRVQAGTYLHKGDRIGHPSCEGGFSTGTHIHLARKYNGVWITADGQVPFNLAGWVSTSEGAPYDGSMNRGGTELRACAWWRSCEISTHWELYDSQASKSQKELTSPIPTQICTENACIQE